MKGFEFRLLCLDFELRLFKLKKNSKPVSRILSPRKGPVIDLRLQSPAAFSNLPFAASTKGTGASSSVHYVPRYTWFCNLRGVRHPMLPPNPVGSYPTFSPLPEGGYFLLHLHDLTAIFPLRSAVLFVVRTFLLPMAGDRPACCAAKVLNFIQSGATDTFQKEPNKLVDIPSLEHGKADPLLHHLCISLQYNGKSCR